MGLDYRGLLWTEIVYVSLLVSGGGRSAAVTQTSQGHVHLRIHQYQFKRLNEEALSYVTGFCYQLEDILIALY